MTIAIKWEADDVRGVMVPARIHGVTHDVADLWKHVFDQGLVTAQRDPLAQVRGDTYHQTLAGPGHPRHLLLLTPALQLSEHGLQLEVPSLLIQQTVVLGRVSE